jgi:hypothetical protein
MSRWLALLKNEKGGGTHATKATETPQTADEGVFVGFVAYPPAHFQNIEGTAAASNDPAPQPQETPPTDPDRWCWPHSDAMNGLEVAAFTARLDRFTSKGLPLIEAERLADRLVIRDRGQDDRSTCLECSNLAGRQRCAQWQRAGIGGPAIPTDLLALLQRCDGFAPHLTQDTTHD